jgi:hypothetical protein
MTGQSLTGNPMPVSNVMTNFGWEYVWHCHLLGHEENDMMRPLIMRKRAVADFDGDFKTDISVWRPGNGYWYILRSSDGGMTTTQWGGSYFNDVPVPPSSY